MQKSACPAQSLDADGNPENGISIPASAASAVSAAINLDSDPAAFTASAELQKAREAGGVARTGKDSGAGEGPLSFAGYRHARHQHMGKYHDDRFRHPHFRGWHAANICEGEATPDDSCDTNRVCGGNLISKAGVEYGVARLSAVDGRGFKFAAKPVLDTNLHAGLSNPRPNWRIRTDGSDLITSDVFTVQRKREQKSLFGELFHIAGTLEISSSKEPIKTEVKEIRFFRMENDPKGILAHGPSDPVAIKTPTYAFFSNGKYMMIDPVGELNGLIMKVAATPAWSLLHTPTIQAAKP